MKISWLVTLVPGSFAISLLEVIQTNPELSTLSSYIAASPNATSFLANSNNFTFLAPNNEAISALVQSKGNASLIGNSILASIQYGMLKGGFPTLSFSNESIFVSTNLANPGYANVTGGQAVELSLDDAANPQVVSGNKSTAGVGDVSSGTPAQARSLTPNRNSSAPVELSTLLTSFCLSLSKLCRKFQPPRCSTSSRFSTRLGT